MRHDDGAPSHSSRIIATTEWSDFRVARALGGNRPARCWRAARRSRPGLTSFNSCFHLFRRQPLRGPATTTGSTSREQAWLAFGAMTGYLPALARRRAQYFRIPSLIRARASAESFRRARRPPVLPALAELAAATRTPRPLPRSGNAARISARSRSSSFNRTAAPTLAHSSLGDIVRATQPPDRVTVTGGQETINPLSHASETSVTGLDRPNCRLRLVSRS